ncbi:T9SS type A sorting domain-containing protein, partial [bacterium]|nr:T9SS type A sorting domain-containing protein [bacterium]
YERRDSFFETTQHTVYYDQTDPLNPVVLDHVVAPASDDQKGLAIVAQDDHVALLHSWHRIPDQNECVEEIAAMTADGQRHSLIVGWWARACLVGDVAWVLGSGFDAPFALRSYKVGSGTPILLGETYLAVGRWLAPVDDHLLVDSGDGVAVYDVSDPQEPAYRGFYQDEFPIDLPVVVRKPLLISSHAGGIALHELTLESDPLIRPRGRLAMGTAPAVLEPAGDRLAVASESGWRLISLQDPDHPAELCDWIPVTASSFVWGDQDLYVDTPGAVYRYDLGEPGNPIWAGQSRYASGTASLAVRGNHLLNDGQILPLDCLDVVGVQGPGDQSLPTVAVELFVTPNPFNPRTAVTFTLNRADHTTISVHDIRGRRVATLADARFEAGNHSLNWTGRDDAGRTLPSGAYLIRLRTKTAVRTTKAVLLR